MKLLDLLKSLNSGTAADPDAAAIASPASPPALSPQALHPQETHPQEIHPQEQQRDELLDELSTILSLLDAAPAAKNPAAASSLSTEQKNAEQQALLNLAEIFEEDLAANADPEEHAAPLLFMPAATTASDQSDQIKPSQENRKHLVQALLGELLPALEKALDERLQQLDAATLQQLELAVAQNSNYDSSGRA